MSSIVNYQIITEVKGNWRNGDRNVSASVSVRNETMLEYRVQQLIFNGWEPSGGVAICYEKGILTYSQAMVLYEQSNNDEDDEEEEANP